MKVFVTVELYQGLISEVQVFQREASSDQAEREWLKKNTIKEEIDREVKAQNGYEFFMYACEVEP